MWQFFLLVTFLEIVAIGEDCGEFQTKITVHNPRVNRKELWHENQRLFWVVVVGETPMRVFDIQLRLMEILYVAFLKERGADLIEKHLDTVYFPLVCVLQLGVYFMIQGLWMLKNVLI